MKVYALLTGLAIGLPYVLARALPQVDDTLLPTIPFPSDTKSNDTESANGSNSPVSSKNIWNIPEDTLMADINDLAKTQPRKNFTVATVKHARATHSTFNWVIVHPAHVTDFDEGTQSRHFHVEFKNGPFTTIGFEIYAFESGTFVLTGDGTEINWAYEGDIVSDIVSDIVTKEGKKKTIHTVVFS